MRILLYEWNGLMQRDIKAVLRKMGVNVWVMGYDLFSKQSNEEYFYVNLLKKIDSLKIHAVMSVCFFPVIAKACDEKGIVYINWIYDSPFVPRDMESFRLECVYSFIFDKICAEQLKKENINVCYLPLAVNVPRLDSIEMTPNEEAKYTSDISFVGQLYRSDKPENDNLFALHMYQTYQERVRLLNMLSLSYQVKLYSPEKNCQELPYVESMGTVMYYTEMPKVFKLSKINLNITLKSIQSGLPLRILDILGCGGFLISNFQQEMEEFFEIGKELEIYRNPEELEEKVDFYLKHEELRCKIAEKGRKRVLKSFSYEKQLREIFSICGLRI